MKKLLCILLPTSFLCGATFVKLTQLEGEKRVSILSTSAAGSVQQLGIGAGLEISNNQLNTVNSSSPSIPSLTVFKVTATTANAFPMPDGKSFCYVTRNMPQSPVEDYNVTNRTIVFTVNPVIGDVVQLLCW